MKQKKQNLIDADIMTVYKRESPQDIYITMTKITNGVGYKDQHPKMNFISVSQQQRDQKCYHWQGQRLCTDISQKKNYKWPTNTCKKKFSGSLAFREMQIKTTIKYPLPPARTAIIKEITQLTNTGTEKKESVYTAANGN